MNKDSSVSGKDFKKMMKNKKAMMKPKNAGATFARIMRYVLKHNKREAVLIVVFTVLQSLTSIVGLVLLQNLVDAGIMPVVEGKTASLTTFFMFLSIMTCSFLISAVSSYFSNRMVVVMYTGITARIRNDMFEHLQKLPVSYYDTHSHGEVMSRFTNDADTLRNLLSMALPQMISSALMIVGLFVAMLIMNPMLTLIIIVVLAAMLFVTSKIAVRSGRLFVKQQKTIGDVNGYVEEFIEGQKVVKVFCHEDKAKGGLDEINDYWAKTATAAHTNANILMPIIGNLAYLQYAVLSAAGGMFILSGLFGVTIGVLASFLPMSRQFTGPIGQVSQQFNAIMLGIAGAERIFELLDQEPETDKGYVTLVNAEIDGDGNITESEARTGKWAWKHPHGDGTLTYKELKGDVQFDGVTFGYEEGKTVLKNIDLYATAGQKIALVGSTGAGKTTITNLINRFYDVPDGKIRYDGINITKIKKDDLRRSLAMVLQDTHLFTGTVRENIRYGKLDATDEDVEDAARLANAYSFIMHLPDGFDTMLTADGANLSQGQRQLLAISRAAVAAPPVLILDEATSSIDTRTERLIELGMDKLMDGRTVFIIAHRLSTVRNADMILVLENGEIIERGNHNELLALRGRYYKLYAGMFEAQTD
jgi:ATP-binding cassette subfamily B protein